MHVACSCLCVCVLRMRGVHACVCACVCTRGRKDVERDEHRSKYNVKRKRGVAHIVLLLLLLVRCGRDPLLSIPAVLLLWRLLLGIILACRLVLLLAAHHRTHDGIATSRQGRNLMSFLATLMSNSLQLFPGTQATTSSSSGRRAGFAWNV